LADQSGIKKAFLEKQQLIWNTPNCFDALDTSVTSGCFLPAVHLADHPSSIEDSISSFEMWLDKAFDLKVRFPMFSGRNGLQMFLNGVKISVFLVMGAIGATLLFSYVFFTIGKAQTKSIRVAASVIRLFFQNTPIILLLMLGYLIVTAFFDYSTWVALSVSIAMIGLNNGANGANALMDASRTFKSDVSLGDLFDIASVPLRAAVINAAKASPVAAFIGAPEMLSALTDITSFTGERITTYLIISVFYMVMVQAVVVVTSIFMKREN